MFFKNKRPWYHLYMETIIHQYPNEPFITKSDNSAWFKQLVLAGWVREINDSLFLYHPEIDTIYVTENNKTFLHLTKRNDLISYEIRSIKETNGKKFKTINVKPPVFELSQEQFTDVQEYVLRENLHFKDIYVMYQDHLNLPDIYHLNDSTKTDTTNQNTANGIDLDSINLDDDN